MRLAFTPRPWRNPNSGSRSIFRYDRLSGSKRERSYSACSKNLPLGTSDFKALRSRGQIYVDKTTMLLRLAEGRSAKVLFTRPRRFGKTLLLSTFESLFAEGLRHFDGLAIDGRWTDHTYPVVRLDFSQLAFFVDTAEFERKFRDFIAFSFSEAGFECEQSDGSLGFRLSRWFNGLPPDSLVVLVDDYDAPLLAAMGSPSTFEAVASLLREFFAVLHCNEDVLRFLFVTGTVKPANARVFDGFGSLTDISLDSAYGTLAGFTIEELERDFTRPLFNAASEQGLGKEALLSQLEEMYGGYRFDVLAEQPVLSPWSVLRFLAEPARGFEQYWFSSPGLSAKLLDNLGENPPVGAERLFDGARSSSLRTSGGTSSERSGAGRASCASRLLHRQKCECCRLRVARLPKP